MKVYLVISIEDGMPYNEFEYGLYGVFTTYEKAEEVRKQVAQDLNLDEDHLFIDESNLDEVNRLW